MELRQALRSLRRTPWYSLTVIGVIALSMTLGTTVFAIVQGVLFKGLPYRDAAELQLMSAPTALSLKDAREWSAAIPGVQMSPYQSTFEVGATTEDRPRRLLGARVGPGFFDVLGQQPILGGFRADQFTFTSARVPALISYRIWRGQFGGAWNVIGQPFDLVGAVDQTRSPLAGFEVAGVLPPDFVYPSMGGTPDLVLPFAPRPDREAERNYGAMGALVRVPKGVVADAVRDRLETVAVTQGYRVGIAEPENPQRKRLIVASDIQTLMGFAAGRGFREAFFAAMMLVGLTAVNVAALSFARARQRKRELAIRVALGASFWRIVRIAATELAPLAVLGLAVGLALAPPAIQLVLSLMSPTTQVMATPAVDIRVVVFTTLTTTALTIASVVLQALGLRARSFIGAVRSGSSVTWRRGRWQSVLVSIQVALASLLVVSGTLFVGSLWWAWQQDPGFEPGAAVMVEVDAGSGPEREVRLRETIERVRAIPGVRLGILQGEFLNRSRSSPAVVRPQGALPGSEQGLSVGGDYFAIVGMTPLAGRLPTRAELEGRAPVAVVSERVARNFWPGANAIGQTLTSRSQNATVRTVIGVVRDARLNGIDTAPAGQIYFPVGEVGPTLIVLGPRPADTTLREVSRAVRSVGAPVGVTRATTLGTALGEPMRNRSFGAWLYGGFAIAGLLIASIGILGLVAMTTALRTREIGVRSALGARPLTVVAMMLREQIPSVGAGLFVGGLAASWTVQSLKTSMFQFSVYDVRLWTLSLLTVLVAAMLGSLIPALRAARTSAMQALRTD